MSIKSRILVMISKFRKIPFSKCWKNPLGAEQDGEQCIGFLGRAMFFRWIFWGGRPRFNNRPYIRATVEDLKN